MSEVLKNRYVPPPKFRLDLLSIVFPLVPNNTLPPDLPWLPREE